MPDNHIVAAILAAAAIQRPDFALTSETARKVAEFYRAMAVALYESDPVQKASKKERAQ
jgi:hypothetical protein